MDASFERIPDEPIPFSIIGSGWRAEFYLRIAAALPRHFRVAGVLVRDEQKREAFRTLWNVPAHGSVEDLLRDQPQFVVGSVPWAVSPPVLRDLAKRGVPALAETPPAPDLAGLVELYRETRGAKIQVAEQYHLQPLHAARLSLAASGRLGRVSQAQVSVAHGYHGISLLRRFLNIRAENVTIRAFSFKSPLIAGPNRNGPPQKENVGTASQTIAWFDFGDRLGIYDFTGDQYFSWIRSPRLLVRGERGEINHTAIRYLQDFRTPIQIEFVRHDAGHDGNLEGFYHKGITLGDEWLYRNPFPGARLADDEIAIATCLWKMSRYVHGEPDFYSLAEASQDHYLGLMMDRAVESGAAVETTAQPWSQELAAST